MPIPAPTMIDARMAWPHISIAPLPPDMVGRARGLKRRLGLDTGGEASGQAAALTLERGRGHALDHDVEAGGLAGRERTCQRPRQLI